MALIFLYTTLLDLKIRERMSNIIKLDEYGLTGGQRALVKATVAKGATDDELNLFLYRCKNMGLDPLKPGQVHFIKYGSAPGTIIVGIDGFRARAAKTGKHVGTKRGLIRDDKGKCLGAWAEVYRSDWTHPAKEEVSLAEYSTGKGQWSKMPETMIKKVAEVAALRMAFPDELGGLYSNDEMDQAEQRHSKVVTQNDQVPLLDERTIEEVLTSIEDLLFQMNDDDRKRGFDAVDSFDEDIEKLKVFEERCKERISGKRG